MRIQRTSEAVEELPVTVSDLGASLQLAYDGRLGRTLLQLDDEPASGFAGEPLHLAKGSIGRTCEDGGCKSHSGEDSGEEMHDDHHRKSKETGLCWALRKVGRINVCFYTLSSSAAAW